MFYCDFNIELPSRFAVFSAVQFQHRRLVKLCAHLHVVSARCMTCRVRWVPNSKCCSVCLTEQKGFEGELVDEKKKPSVWLVNFEPDSEDSDIDCESDVEDGTVVCASNQIVFGVTAAAQQSMREVAGRHSCFNREGKPIALNGGCRRRVYC